MAVTKTKITQAEQFNERRSKIYNAYLAIMEEMEAAATVEDGEKTDDLRILNLTFADGSHFQFRSWWGGDPVDWIPAGLVMVEVDGELFQEDDKEAIAEANAKAASETEVK